MARLGMTRSKARWLAAAAVGTLLLAALPFALDKLFPLDLGRYRMSGHLVTDRAGEPLRYLPAKDGVWRLAVQPEEVDPDYIARLLRYEDRRFLSHPGIDPLAALRAAGRNLAAGRVVSGASTLTMQVARLLHPGPRGWRGKILQVFRALQLEAHHDKREILAMYLTLAPFGGNIEGVHMASRLYFGKEPRKLDAAETALLIALPQSPTARRPILHPEAAMLGRARVLEKLAMAGLIDEDEAEKAASRPLPRARHALPQMAPHLALSLSRMAAAPPRIASTLDAGLQRRLEQFASREAEWFPDRATFAILVAELPSRRILASLGQHDAAAPQGEIDMTRARRSPGSTLKPFIYGLALDQRLIHAETVIDDQPTPFGAYLPRNFDRHFQGRVTIRDALQQSLNVPAVAVLEKLGPAFFAERLGQLGITLALPGAEQRPGLAIALGGAGTRLLDLTALYAALADGGQYRPLALRADAQPLPMWQLMQTASAAQITDILAESPRPPGVQGIAHNRADRIAYKTGTSYGFRDALAIGYTSTHVVAVWVGRADGTPRPGAYGRNTAAPALFQIFDIIGGRGEEMPSAAAGLSPAAQEGRRDLLPPPGLRHFERRGASSGALALQAPSILFPPPRAELALPAAKPAAMTLEARGAEPLRWYVDGEPLPARGDQGLQAEWHPPGPGFFRISVVDAAGHSAQVRTRLVESEP